jgi:hypothetical protein
VARISGPPNLVIHGEIGAATVLHLRLNYKANRQCVICERLAKSEKLTVYAVPTMCSSLALGSSLAPSKRQRRKPLTMRPLPMQCIAFFELRKLIPR